MTDVSLSQLQQICVTLEGKKRVAEFVSALNVGMTKFEINTPARIAAFIAQLWHESGECRYTEEIASGAAYDTGRLAARLGNTPADDDDGERYKGRGLIQITGTENYRRCSKALNVNFLQHPKLLAELPYSVESACWYWRTHKLNELADIGSFDEITRRINGGQNGAADRHRYWERAKQVLGAE